MAARWSRASRFSPSRATNRRMRSRRPSLGRCVSSCPSAKPMRSVQLSEKFSEMTDVSSYVASLRSEEHTSELQSLMRISYAVFCLKKTKTCKHDNEERETRPSQEYKMT